MKTKQNKYRVVDYSNHEDQNDWGFNNKKEAVKFAIGLFEDQRFNSNHTIIFVEEITGLFGGKTIWDRQNCSKGIDCSGALN